MRHSFPTFVVLSLLTCAPLLAQGFTYSPASAATIEQNTSAAFLPIGSPGLRVQQVHADQRGIAGVVDSIAFRRDGVLGPDPSYVGRTALLELRMGPGSQRAFDIWFDQNYTGASTRVFDGKPIALPSWVANSGAPAPWDVVIPFDTGFLTDGTADLVWEVLVSSTSAGRPYPADGAASASTGLGEDICYGNGCLVAGRRAEMLLLSDSFADGTHQALDLRWQVYDAPASTLGAIWLGSMSLEVPVPGLCAPVLVGGVFTSLSYQTEVDGFARVAVQIPWSAPLAGAVVFGQAAALDPGRPTDLPLALSSGVESTLATAPATVPIVNLVSLGAQSQTGALTRARGIAVRFAWQ